MTNSKMKGGRFSDMNPKRTNSFRKNRPNNISIPPKTTGRWAKLDSDSNTGNSFRSNSRFKKNSDVPQKNSRWGNLNTDNERGNRFSNSATKNSFVPQENSRWGNLKTDNERSSRFSDNDTKNSFKYRKPRYRGKKGNGLFRGAKMQDGVPQIKGCTQRGFNVMDVIQVKPKKTKKNKTPKNKIVDSFQEEKKEKPEEKTEEEIKQEDLWKQSILQQYAYESFSEDEDEVDE